MTPWPGVADRFWAKVDKSGDCWLWTAGTNGRGYGTFWASPSYVRAHRYSYELANGIVLTPDIYVDHKCHNTLCVRPDHLVAGPPKKNSENRKGATKRSKSGVRGVGWDKRHRKWRASVGHHGRSIHVGYFDLLEDAERAVQAKREELYGVVM